MMITRPEQVLRLNGLTISDGAGEAVHEGGFTIETLSADANFGHAEPLRVSLATELLDGEAVEVTGYNNREDLYFRVEVRAADAEGLALGGKLLEEITGRPGELEWTPPAAFGETTVFDVATSDLEWLFDDMDELRVKRVYGLRIEAHPFGRPTEPVVVAAAESGESTPEVREVIDDGTSTTGWSATVRGASVPIEGPPPGYSAKPLRTNLVPNPRVNVSTATFAAARWSTGNSGAEWTYTSSLSDPWSLFGAYGAIRLVTTLGDIPVVAGKQYAGAIRLSDASDVAAGGRLRLHWFNASGGEISSVSSAAMPANPSGVFTVTGTAPTGAVNLRLWLELSGGYPSVRPSQAIVDQAAAAGAYFDGDTADTSATIYRWRGTPGLSASEAVAAGVTALTRSGLSVDFAGTPFLHVDHESSESPAVSLGAASATLVNSAPMGSGVIRSVYQVGESEVSSITLSSGAPTSAAPMLRVLEMARSTSPSPLSTTARQLSRAFPVHGTRRTTGSLHISHQEPLGPVLAYCTADDGSRYQPSMRIYKTSGAPDTPDPDTMSGARTSLIDPYEVQVPRSVLPAGTCSIWARAVPTDSGDHTLSAQFQPIGGAIPMPTKTLAPVTFSGTEDVSELLFLGHMDVAEVAAASDVWKQRIRVTKSTSLSIGIDDLYVFNHTTGSLVILEDVPTRHLWIDAPTVQAPFPKMYAGNEPDRSDAAPIGHMATRWDVLGMPPGQMNIFTALGVANGAVAAEYFPRVAHNVYKIIGDAA